MSGFTTYQMPTPREKQVKGLLRWGISSITLFEMTAFVLLFILTLNMSAQSIAINNDGSAPDASSLLDISSSSKGLLIPRMTSAQKAAISSPAHGLLTYQNNGTQGIYYNIGTAGTPSWSQVYTTATALGVWYMTGNSGTTAGTHYIGSSDGVALVCKTNGTERFRILSGGNVGIGTTTPGSALEVSGKLKTSTFQATTNAGNTYLFYSDAAGLGTWRNYTTTGFNKIADADGDTKIQTEKSSDEDIIRFDLNGTERLTIQAQKFYLTNSGNSTLVGEDAGLNNSLSGTYSTLIGYQAGKTMTSASSCTNIGYRAGYTNLSSYNNTNIGHQSGYANTGWWGLTYGASANKVNANAAGYVFGAYAVYTPSISSSYIIGCEAVKNMSSAPYVKIGYRAEYNNTTGSASTVIGSKAGYYSTGSYTQLIGYQAGAGTSNHQKHYTTMIGYQAGYSSNAASCIFLGYQAGYNETNSNLLYIENSNSSTPLIFGDFTNDYVTILSNLGVGSSSFGSGTNVLAIENGTAPSASITDGVLLYAEDVSARSELKVRDEAGNVTTLSPHNFSLMEKSEPMAWSFYSENHAVGKKINVDMLKTIRLVEKLSGEQLVYRAKTDGTIVKEETPMGIEDEIKAIEKQLKKELKQLKKENRQLKRAVRE